MSLLEDTRKLIDMYKLGKVKKILNIIDEELMKIPNTRTFRQRGIISVNYEKKFGLIKFLEHVLEFNPNFLFHVGFEITQLNVLHRLVDQLSDGLGVLALHRDDAETVF